MKGCFLLLIILFSFKSDGQLLTDSSMLRAISEFGFSDTKTKFKSFSGRTLDGRVYTSDSLSNKIAMINFWFEQCTPCIAEFGALNSLYRKYKGNKDFQFITFTFDDTVTALRVAKKYNLEYPIISLTRDSINRLIFNLGYPTNLIVDKFGEIAFIKCGGSTDSKRAKEEIETLFIRRIEQLLIDDN